VSENSRESHEKASEKKNEGERKIKADDKMREIEVEVLRLLSMILSVFHL